MLRPFLAWSIQKKCNGGEDITAEDSPVIIRQKIDSAKYFLQEYHIQLDGCCHLMRSVKSNKFKRSLLYTFNTELHDDRAWNQCNVRADIY